MRGVYPEFTSAWLEFYFAFFSFFKQLKLRIRTLPYIKQTIIKIFNVIVFNYGQDQTGVQAPLVHFFWKEIVLNPIMSHSKLECDDVNTSI